MINYMFIMVACSLSSKICVLTFLSLFVFIPDRATVCLFINNDNQLFKIL